MNTASNTANDSSDVYNASMRDSWAKGLPEWQARAIATKAVKQAAKADRKQTRSGILTAVGQAAWKTAEVLATGADTRNGTHVYTTSTQR